DELAIVPDVFRLLDRHADSFSLRSVTRLNPSSGTARGARRENPTHVRGHYSRSIVVLRAAFSSRASTRDVADRGRGLDRGGRLGASGIERGGRLGWPGRSGADWLGPRDSRERAGLGDCGRSGLLRGGGGGVVGNFVDHIALVDIEMDAGRIFHGDVKSAQDELGAAEIDSVANEGVDDLHERGLDAFLV